MSPIMGLLPGHPAESLRPRLRRDRHDPAGRTSRIHRNPRTTDAHPARRHRLAQTNAREHEPVRIDDRDRPPHPAQREALVLGRDGAALDRRRHARSREAVSTDHRLPQPRNARRRDRTRPRPSPSRRCCSHPDQGGRYRPQRLTITPGPPPKFHGARDILDARGGGVFLLSAAPCSASKAAVLCSRLVRNHPLPDGNKRVAYISLREFVERNGYGWTSPDANEAIQVLEAIAARGLSEGELARRVAGLIARS